MHLENTKAPLAFRTISEVASELDLPPHVLRFWEGKFPNEIKPVKRSGGRRYYRQEDIHHLRSIKHLLYTQGLTIKGAQKVLREHRFKIKRVSEQPVEAATEAQEIAQAAAPVVAQPVVSLPGKDQLSPAMRHELESLLGELQSLRGLLKQLGV
ncbi:MAG: MerR family transcriptional regulator [Alphaproteobacteria bacterium]|nr:MerR family transcriptional regulator [Alphaproteobacteria bacterium]NDG04756.1 MerR family transcriptional regulator [Alphaproteobacteria bacterium]